MDILFILEYTELLKIPLKIVHCHLCLEANLKLRVYSLLTGGQQGDVKLCFKFGKLV